jgi:hypothetical protein
MKTEKKQTKQTSYRMKFSFDCYYLYIIYIVIGNKLSNEKK